MMKKIFILYIPPILRFILDSLRDAYAFSESTKTDRWITVGEQLFDFSNKNWKYIFPWGILMCSLPQMIRTLPPNLHPIKSKSALNHMSYYTYKYIYVCILKSIYIYSHIYNPSSALELVIKLEN